MSKLPESLDFTGGASLIRTGDLRIMIRQVKNLKTPKNRIFIDFGGDSTHSQFMRIYGYLGCFIGFFVLIWSYQNCPIAITHLPVQSQA